MSIFTAIVDILLVIPRYLRMLWRFLAEGKFLRALMGGAVRTTPQIAAQLLLFFGLTLAVNNLAVPAFRDVIVAQITSLPTQWVQFIALTKIDQCFTVMLSAYGIAAARKIHLRPRANASLWGY